MKPQSLKIFDNFLEKSLLDLEEQKQADKKIAGIYCIFAPVELIYAAGAIPVGLCGKREKPISAAEKTLPPNLCPLIKSSYGYAVTETCPFFAASDIIIGETTCDGKKKMYEFLGRIKPLFLMHLPYMKNTKNAQLYWFSEVLRLKDYLENETGIKITADSLRESIKDQNRIRRLSLKISKLWADNRLSLSGLDMCAFLETKGFVVNPKAYADNLELVADELEHLASVSQTICKKPRILVTGCPIGTGSEKVIRIIEESGARVVCLENCSGIKSMNLLTDEDDKNPFEALARRYLDTPCSCMTPNQGRFDFLAELIKEYNVDGIVDMTWMFCHTYNIEAHQITDFSEKKLEIPCLRIYTDYSDSDEEQIRTRVQAFLEIME